MYWLSWKAESTLETGLWALILPYLCGIKNALYRLRLPSKTRLAEVIALRNTTLWVRVEISPIGSKGVFGKTNRTKIQIPLTWLENQIFKLLWEQTDRNDVYWQNPTIHPELGPPFPYCRTICAPTASRSTSLCRRISSLEIACLYCNKKPVCLQFVTVEL